MSTETKRRARRNYSLAEIARAKALYVVKGVQPQEIVKRLDIPEDTLRNWIVRGKWLGEKKGRLARLENNAMARANDENASFLESMASQAEEVAEDSMQLAREKANERNAFSAKDLQSASQAVKNMVDVYFKARRIDANTGNATVNIGQVFVNAPEAKRVEKHVVDLGKVEPPQVSA